MVVIPCRLFDFVDSEYIITYSCFPGRTSFFYIINPMSYFRVFVESLQKPVEFSMVM